MTDIFNPLLQWLNAHPNWAGLATFVISTIESVAIIGTIIPGTIMMTAVGALAGAGVIPLWLTLVCAIAGAIVGDGISYLLGYHFKDRIRVMWPFRTNPQWIQKGEAFFHKHGGKSVFIGRFVGPVRAIVPLIAGMLGMKPLKFYVANILSAIGWAPAYLLPGIILGAASLELPPDIAVHVLLMFLFICLFIVLCAWLIIKIFVLIGNRIERILSWIWNHLEKSRYVHSLTVMLKHHNPEKSHGQLVLAFYLVIVLFCFFYLFSEMHSYPTDSWFLNNASFYFFRSLRSSLSDKIIFAITLLGDKYVISITTVIFIIGLMLVRRFYLAFHVILLLVLSGLSINIIKQAAHVTRPWGLSFSLETFSFPSAHTTLATVFYVGIALLLSKAYPSRKRIFIGAGVAIAILVGLSRLYLGAHWFTDVIGGWLLGASLLIIVVISYNRTLDFPKNLGILAFSLLIILVPVYLSVGLYYFINNKTSYALLEYPVYHISDKAWWEQSDVHLPIYRVNRFGGKMQHFNLQWLGNFETIQKTLLQNDWEIPPERNWISIIERIADLQNSETLPIVPALHLDKKPILVLIKHTINPNKPIMVLRLWNSNVIIKPQNQVLWVGTVTLIPRTYSWLFRKKSDEVELQPNLLFTQIPAQLEVKVVTLPSRAHHKNLRHVLLIRSKV